MNTTFSPFLDSHVPDKRVTPSHRHHARAVFPRKMLFSAHLISRILVEEESDRTEDGQRYSSHFELYLTAMRTLGANTQPIKQFLQRLSQGDILIVASESVGLPPAIQEFVCTTFNFFAWDTHILAAAFVYGREGRHVFSVYPTSAAIRKNDQPETTNID